MNYLCMRQIDEFHIDYFKRNELHQKVYIKLYDYIFMIFSKKKKTNYRDKKISGWQDLGVEIGWL